jgi:hypothetical protein
LEPEMAISLFAFVTQLAFATALPASSSLAVKGCELGEIYAFSNVECQFEFQNAGDKPVRIVAATPNRPDDKADSNELVVSPHSHAYLRTSLKTGNSIGNSDHVFQFRTSDGGEYRAKAHAFVMTALDQIRPEIDFGVVEAGAEQSAKKSIALSSAECPDLRITKLLESPSWLDAKLEKDGRSVSGTIRQGVDWGINSGYIRVQLNCKVQLEAWIAVKADVHGAVIPAFNPLDTGLLRLGDNNTFRIPLSGAGGKTFEIGNVQVNGLEGDIKEVPCEPAVAACRWLELKISDSQPKGLLKGSILVSFRNDAPRLRIGVRGFLAEKDFVTKKIDDKMLEQNSASSSTASAPRAPLQNAIANAVRESSETLPAGKGPLLRWHLANGQAIHGFQIFRAEAEEGPFTLLNRPTVPSTAEDDESVGYNFRDNKAESGKTYWYYIGIVYNDGHKQQLTGPQKVVAK